MLTKTRSFILLFCVLAAGFLNAQGDAGFQPGKVVGFEKLAADASHQSGVERYKIAILLNGIIYYCHVTAPAAVFMDWTLGKEFPSRLGNKGKTMTVKTSNGQETDLNVVGKKDTK